MWLSQVYSPLPGIVTLVDRPGDVLVFGNKYSLFPPHVIHCTQCGNYLHSGVAEFQNRSLCCFSNWESESKRESESELKNSRQTIFGVYSGRGFGTRPYLRTRRFPKGD